MTKFNQILLVVFFYYSPAVFSLEFDPHQEINLSADSALIQDSQGISIYTGHVELVQGDLLLNAERLNVHYKEGNIDQIVAYGEPATLQRLNKQAEATKSQTEITSDKYQDKNPGQETDDTDEASKDKSSEWLMQAEAKQISYFINRREIQLHEDAILRQAGDSFRGNYIVYDIEHSSVYASGKTLDQQNQTEHSGRVHVIINPDQ